MEVKVHLTAKQLNIGFKFVCFVFYCSVFFLSWGICEPHSVRPGWRFHYGSDCWHEIFGICGPHGADLGTSAAACTYKGTWHLINHISDLPKYPKGLAFVRLADKTESEHRVSKTDKDPQHKELLKLFHTRFFLVISILLSKKERQANYVYMKNITMFNINADACK